ncbi:MAG: zinc ABC transporter substrate-binding protein [Caldilineaceae bacterium]|nr:zinc ABC transporter substrate-binding protein [Caldilineaceae bacterium]
MKSPIKFLCLLILVAVASGCAAPTPAPAPATTPGKLQVVTTVSPITNIIQNVGGDRIDVTGIVPEGVNSHTFEPAPSDARLLAQADIIFVNGLFLEEPTIKLAEANKREGVGIVSLGEQTVTPDEYVFDFSFPKEAGNPNPHLWMNPLYAARYAELVAESLAEKDPASADFYRANAAAFAERIDALDEAVAATVATIPAANRRLLTYHDSFAYFAPRYGITVLGAVQPADFSEPSAQEVARLITQLREEKIPAIFGSEVFPSPILEQIAKESGAVYIDQLRDDDLPGEPGDDNHSYFGLMVEDVRVMADALGGDASGLDGIKTGNLP